MEKYICPICEGEAECEYVDPLNMELQVFCKNCGVLIIPGNGKLININGIREKFKTARQQYPSKECRIVLESLELFANKYNDKYHIFVDQSSIVEGGKSTKNIK